MNTQQSKEAKYKMDAYLARKLNSTERKALSTEDKKIRKSAQSRIYSRNKAKDTKFKEYHKEYQKNYQKQYRLDNPDKQTNYYKENSKYYEDYRTKTKEYHKDYYQANKEKHLQNNKDYRLRKKLEKQQAKEKAKQLENIEKEEDDEYKIDIDEITKELDLPKEDTTKLELIITKLEEITKLFNKMDCEKLDMNLEKGTDGVWEIKHKVYEIKYIDEYENEDEDSDEDVEELAL